jgi:hypothetical protein
MTKMIAEAQRRLLWVPEGGIEDVSAPLVSELEGAEGVLLLSCLVTKANYNFGATGDESINDPAACARGNSTVPGNTSYEAGFDFFRWTTELEDEAWNTFNDKGLAGFLVERIGKDFDVPIVATDPLKVMGVITGTPRDLVPDASGGFEKFRQEFFPQAELIDLRAVAAAA